MLKLSNTLQHIMVSASAMMFASCSEPSVQMDTAAEGNNSFWREANIEELKYNNIIYLFEVSSNEVYFLEKPLDEEEFIEKIDLMSGLSPKPVLILELHSNRGNDYIKKIMSLVENRFGCETGKCFLLEVKS